jgi:DNA-binding XRE family transcriptional regulator
LKTPPDVSDEFEPCPDIPGAFVWKPRWTPKQESEIAAGAEALRQSMSQLRQLRDQFDLSQEELAVVLGMSQSAISKMERKTEPRLSVIRKVIEHKGGTLKVVVTFDGKDTVLPI